MRYLRMATIFASLLLILSGAAAATWSDSLADMDFPNEPATGELHGQPFVVEKASLQGDILELRQGQDFFPDLATRIFLFADDDSIPGDRFEIGRDFQNMRPHVHVQWREEGASLPETTIHTDGYTLRLEFDQAQGDTIPGRIYLCVGDAERSFVAGNFVAELEQQGGAGDASGAVTIPEGMPEALAASVLQGKSLAGMILVGIGGLVLCIASIWLIVVAFIVHPLWGVACLFLPFAGLIFVILHWRRAAKPFLLSLLGTVLAIGGMVMTTMQMNRSFGDMMQKASSMQSEAASQFMDAPSEEEFPPEEEELPPETDVDEVEVGDQVQDVLRRLGRPTGRLEAGGTLILRYPSVTVVSRDGVTVSEVDWGDGQ